jgi:hypothetical protein
MAEKSIYLTFIFISHKYHVYYKSDEGVRGLEPLIKFALGHAVSKMKEECEGAAWTLVSKPKK